MSLESLPGFIEWQRQDPSLRWPMHLFVNTRIETLYSVSRLFWPALLEREGGLFLADWFNEESFVHWRGQTDDMSLIESMLNRRWVHDLVDDTHHTPAEYLHQLGQIIAACWRARLREATGDDAYEVWVQFSAQDEECAIGFHRKVSRRRGTSTSI